MKKLHKALRRLLNKILQNQTARIIFFASIFIIGGILAIVLTKAASPTVQLEPESGSITSTASSKADSSASNGNFVQFGGGITTPFDLPDTNYTIPSGAIYVSPSVAASGDGSLASPYKTITEAVTAVPSGGTIVLRGGIYREKIGGGKISKAFTLQAYPHEKPWVDGSVPVTGWTNDTNGAATIYRHDGWTAPELCRTRTTTSSTTCVAFVPSGSAGNLLYTDGTVTDSNGTVITPGSPTAALLDQTFIDGRPLTQVTSKGAVAPGTFYVDVSGQKLYVGDNPSGKTVEGTIHDYGLWANAGVKVMGVGFRKFASAPCNSLSIAGVVIAGTGATLKDSVVLYNSAAGLSVSGSGATIDNVISAYNGLQGGKSDSAVNLVVKNSRFTHNNTEGFQVGAGASIASGLKITNSARAVTAPLVQNSTFDNNDGNGLWFDVGVDGAKIISNVAYSNTSNGIFYEISKNGTIASNRAYNNHTNMSNPYGSNIQVNSSTSVRVYNNTTYGSVVGIGFYYDGRNSMGGLSVVNNVMSNVNSSRSLLEAQDVAGTTPAIASVPGWFTTINGNVYRRNNTSSPTNIISMQNKGAAKVGYANVAAARVAGYEATGADTTNNIFTDPTSFNFALTQSFTGLALPSDIATMIGVSAGITSVGYLR